MLKQIVIFGAGGDLTIRYLMPALVSLYEAGHLPEGFAVVAFARDDWDSEDYRRHVGEKLEAQGKEWKQASCKGLLELVEYRRGDATNAEDVKAALGSKEGSSGEPWLAYLAVPPKIAGDAIDALARLELAEGSRVVMEKPFGSDLASARRLNRRLEKTFPGDATFRVDHFLMKQTIQNILGLRFANRLFEQLWNRDHIEQVEITWDETVALEDRAGYYDKAGALRDMVQNHLLQLLCLIGMEAPLTFSARDLRDRKVDVLRAVPNLSPEEVGQKTIRARYAAGKLDGKEVPAYLDEDGIDPERKTETFAQVTLTINNWRWHGVPFVLRTGKAMGEARREILIRFKAVPHLAFEKNCPDPNTLRLQLNPDRVVLGLSVNGPGDPFELEAVELEAEMPPQDLPSYARLLLHALEGDSTLSIRGDEAEEAWRIVEPILHAWEGGEPPLQEYPAGTSGPDGHGG